MSKQPPVCTRCAGAALIKGMWLVHLVLGLMALYAAIVMAMYVGQTWLLFPTALARIARVQTPASTQRLEVQTSDGESLIGMRIRGTASGRLTLLGFGGNAWNAKVTALTLHNLLPDHDVVAFHYRGYSPSSGRPSDTNRALGLAGSVRVPTAGLGAPTDRCGRVQHRVRGRRLSCPTSTCRRADPGHALRFTGDLGSGSFRQVCPAFVVPLRLRGRVGRRLRFGGRPRFRGGLRRGVVLCGRRDDDRPRISALAADCPHRICRVENPISLDPFRAELPFVDGVANRRSGCSAARKLGLMSKSRL
jgi:hypothetical protein